MSSLEELELQFRNNEMPDWPGYKGKLEFRELKHQDSRILIPILKSDKSNLSTFLGKFHGHRHWNLRSAQGFVSGLLREGWPSMTWLFHINEEPIGLVSTARAELPNECQLIISVFSKHQGKGFASAMTKVILKITEEVFGFQRTWWHVDAANLASIQVAQKSGFEFLDTYDINVSSKQTTGLYYRFVKERPHGLSDGILQGASIEYWWVAKDPAILSLIIENKKAKELMLRTLKASSDDSRGNLVSLEDEQGLQSNFSFSKRTPTGIGDAPA